MRAIINLSAVLVLIVALAVVGNADYKDAQEEKRHYTEMVCGGHWPDYESLSPACH